MRGQREAGFPVNPEIREIQVLDTWLAIGAIVAMGAFLLLGGPVWAASTARVFRTGPGAPGWLAVATVWVSRAVGGAMILVGLVLAGTLLWVPG